VDTMKGVIRVEISTGESFLMVLLSFVADFVILYVAYKTIRWICHMIFPQKQDPNLFFTNDGKPIRRAPWNGKLNGDMEEYERDKEKAEAAAMAYIGSSEYYQDNCLTSKVYSITKGHLNK
jgi:hypothetical protein